MRSIRSASTSACAHLAHLPLVMRRDVPLPAGRRPVPVVSREHDVPCRARSSTGDGRTPTKRRSRGIARRRRAAGVGLAKSKPDLNVHAIARIARRASTAPLRSRAPAAGTVTAEGMTTYATLVDATLARGTMPRVAPQLKSITLGGASPAWASRRRRSAGPRARVGRRVGRADRRRLYRPLHARQRTPRVCSTASLTPTARWATPRVTARIASAPASSPSSIGAMRARRPFFDDMARLATRPDVDFLDGVAFAPRRPRERRRFVDGAPSTSDYGFGAGSTTSRSANARSDFLTTRGYLWRWDTDWFCISKQIGAQHPLARRLLGRERPNSGDVPARDALERAGLRRAWQRLRGVQSRRVGDPGRGRPARTGAAFLEFLAREIGIRPVWLCLLRARPRRALHALSAGSGGDVHQPASRT